MSNDKAELRAFLKERDDLFKNPTLEAAQSWWLKAGHPQWAREDVPLAAVHKARLQWLESTDAMIEESIKWLQEHDYSIDWQGAPPLTPERRDADRVSLGKKPLGQT